MVDTILIDWHIMKSGTFYIVNEELKIDSNELLLPLACQICAEQWLVKKRVLVACQSQQQAEQLDELLWQFDPNHFIPHNLAGEGPRYGAPVELCWPERRGQSKRALLINLQLQLADNTNYFQEIIDFVPPEEKLKELARERYKMYRQLGFSLQTLPAPTSL